MSSTGDEKSLFHITVASSPSPSLALTNDLAMTKAALLYGDRATLCSLTCSLLFTFLQLGNLNGQQRVDFLQATLPALATDVRRKAEVEQAIIAFRQLKPKVRPSGREMILQAKLHKIIDETFSELSKTYTEMAEQAGAVGFVQAMNEGLLDVHIFGQEPRAGATNFDYMVNEYVEVVERTMNDHQTYPMFDDMVATLLRAGVNEGKIKVSEAGTRQSRQAALVSFLFERLPLFEAATVDEVLDIRRELHRPLIRFRAAMNRYAADLKTPAWDAEFQADAEAVFRREIEPAILDIEDAIRTNGYLISLLKRSTEKPVLPVGSALAMIVSSLAALPALAAAGLGIGVALTLADAGREWWYQKQTIEQNQLYFYYGVKQRLST